MAYAPFGEGYAGGQQWIQFTSAGNAWTVAYNENQTGSLEDFMFRRYSPSQSRWISPDPAGLAAVNPTNPQTWNRYAYVANNPLSYTDPLGLQLGYCQWDDGSTDDYADSGGDSAGGAFGQSSCDGGGGTWVNVVDTTTITVNGDNPDDPGTTTSGITFSPDGLPTSNNATNQPCGLSFSQRAQMFGNGLLNLGIGGAKITGAAAVEAGTSGIGTALAVYAVYSASGNIAAGFTQTLGAFMPNPTQWQQAATIASIGGSPAGLVTLVATGGNITAATSASRWEGIFMFGFRGGATGNPPNPITATGTAVNAGKVVRSGGPKSGC